MSGPPPDPDAPPAASGTAPDGEAPPRGRVAATGPGSAANGTAPDREAPPGDRVGSTEPGAAVDWAGPVAALVLLAWYAATMARGLMWFDSAELALVGRQLGLGHPPGQPLYTWALGLVARLPGVDPLVGMNLLSAVCAAACALPAGALLRRATRAGPGVRVAVLLAAGAVAPVWDQATRIELYAPATLLFLGLAMAAVRRAEGRGRGWFVPGLLAGALAAVNPVFAVAGALAAAPWALPALRRDGGRALAAVVGGALVGLLPYAHLLLVRGATDRLVWGELDAWSGVWAYLTGADYAMTEHAAFDRVPAHLARWLGWMAGEGAAVPFIGVVGWLATPGLRRRAWMLAVAAAMGFGFTLTYGIYHPEIPDYNGYLTPALWLAALGVAGLCDRLPARAAVGAAVVALAVGLVAGERPVWRRSRAGITMPHDLARRFLDAAEPGALLLLESDHLVFPALYLQEIEGVRRDVVVINVGWSASAWYWRFLYGRHPDLPPIDLRAPRREIRLRRLVMAERDRPARVESLPLAARLGIRPCPATWGFALGFACVAAEDDEDAFLESLARWVRGPGRHDLITPRVVAALADQRAEGLWALGDAVGALRAWRAAAGVDPAALPLLPPAPVRPRPPPPAPGAVLIGSLERNRARGAAALEMLGHPDLAARWRAGSAGALP